MTGKSGLVSVWHPVKPILSPKPQSRGKEKQLINRKIYCSMNVLKVEFYCQRLPLWVSRDGSYNKLKKKENIAILPEGEDNGTKARAASTSLWKRQEDTKRKGPRSLIFFQLQEEPCWIRPVVSSCPASCFTQRSTSCPGGPTNRDQTPRPAFLWYCLLALVFRALLPLNMDRWFVQPTDPHVCQQTACEWIWGHFLT